MGIPLTRFAVFEIALFVVVFGGSAALAAISIPWLAPLPLFLLGFTLNFFRDPERSIPGDASTLVSPADGTVTDIVRVEKPPFVAGPARRIGIFLSVFDVHVNRVPIEGVVSHLEYRPGGFRDARSELCSTENEAMDVGLDVAGLGAAKTRILIRQIAGLIARRIVCPVRIGDRFSRGERYGMIKFGSRTEIYVPEADLVDVSVKVGEKVKGGSSVLGRLRGVQ